MLETSLLGWLPNVCRRSAVSGIHSIRPTKNAKHCSPILKEIAVQFKKVEELSRFGCRVPPPSCWNISILVFLGPVRGSLPHQLSKSRSSFFALNRYESRFGCLHPITAVRLYVTFSLPRLLYGAELYSWNLSHTKLNL